MDDQPTCGKGIAKHSTLPATMGALTAAVADVLEHHMKALDLTDESSQAEHEAYGTLVKEHRHAAGQLRSTAERMAGYRDLPMGRHEQRVMEDAQAVVVFQRLVEHEERLLALLRERLAEHHEMLAAMGAGRGQS